MRSAALLSAIFAAGAFSHIIKRQDVVVVATTVDVVTAVEYVYAEVPGPTPTSSPEHHHKHVESSPAAITTSVPAPASSQKDKHHHHHHQISGSAAAPTQDATSYTGVGVQEHNLHRTNHSAPGVTWDDNLAQSAAALAAGCVFEHNVDLGPASHYGQNIASSSPATGSTANELKKVITDMWYNGEVNAFSGLYSQESPNMANFDSWGHFTQVVWKGSKQVGCATHNCPSLGYFTVCNYFPAGNMLGDFAQNVLPSVGEPTIEG